MTFDSIRARTRATLATPMLEGGHTAGPYTTDPIFGGAMIDANPDARHRDKIDLWTSAADRLLRGS
jgi:hypothetical protein